MLLRRVIEHVKAQSWTAVGLDFVIVVVGIWVALMVGQWSNEQQQRKDLARAESEINNEIGNNYYYAYERLAVAPCRKERYLELAELLRASDPQWPGSPGPYGEGILTRHRVLPPVLRSSMRPWLSQAWETELSKGTLDIMDTDKRRMLSAYYDGVEGARDIQEEIFEIESRLQVLTYPLEMTKSDRLRYYDVLAEADAKSAGLELAAEQMIAGIEGNQLLRLTRKEKTERQNFVDERNARRGDVYGNCAGFIELPLLKITPQNNENN